MTRDTIQIMGNAFPGEQLSDLMGRLADGTHRCAIFDSLDGLRAAINDPATKLLLLGAAEPDLPELAEVLRANADVVHEIPVLLYIKDCLPDDMREPLTPEIDDFVLEPLNLSDLHLRVRRLLQQRFGDGRSDLERVKLNLMSYFGMRQFVGNSPSFIKAVEKIPRVATCDAPVLITGDTGTGKEMCARAIHYMSDRANKPFIPVNCASVPTDLFENEMFGHEPGAFTDARHSRRGMIAEAEGGTLFLDEVDSLPLSAQAKLLRFLQDRQYRPLGASSYRQANTRVLAASNKNLKLKLQEGTFREDLYYRLRVVSLWLPSLRERREDILPLALHFLNVAAAEYKRPVNRFSPKAVQKLLAHNWPGNVRELENIVRQAVVLADNSVVHAHDLHLSTHAPDLSSPVIKEPLKVAKARVIEAFERDYLQDILLACGGNISKAAREAQKDRRTFFSLLKKYGLLTGAAKFQQAEAA